MKTIFTIALSLLSVLTFSGYPFEPKQLMLLEFFVIGLSSLLLALEPNNKRIEGSYLDTVIVKSVPSALALLLPVFLLQMLEKIIHGLDGETRNAIAMAVITIVGYVNLAILCTPMTKWKATVVALVGVLLAASVPVSIFLLNDMLGFSPIVNEPVIFLCMIAISLMFTVMLNVFRGKIEKLVAKLRELGEKHKKALDEKIGFKINIDKK